jgi:hypothetical protein
VEPLLTPAFSEEKHTWRASLSIMQPYIWCSTAVIIATINNGWFCLWKSVNLILAVIHNNQNLFVLFARKKWETNYISR